MMAAAVALEVIAPPRAGAGAGAVAPSRAYAAEYRDYLSAYATCTVREHHGQAANAVLSALDAEDLEKNFSGIFADKPVAWVAECPELRIADGLAIWMRGEPLRMALAEALVKADLRNDTTVSFGDRAPLPLPVPEKNEAPAGAAAERGRQRYDARVAQMWLWRFGECVVRSEPALAREWLLAKAGPADDAALGRLAPVFGSCLPEGRKLALDKDMVRGSVAVGYYRLAKARPVAASGVVH